MSKSLKEDEDPILAKYKRPGKEKLEENKREQKEIEKKKLKT